jgi:hypothetical protein
MNFEEAFKDELAKLSTDGGGAPSPSSPDWNAWKAKQKPPHNPFSTALKGQSSPFASGRSETLGVKREGA